MSLIRLQAGLDPKAMTWHSSGFLPGWSLGTASSHSKGWADGGSGTTAGAAMRDPLHLRIVGSTAGTAGTVDFGIVPVNSRALKGEIVNCIFYILIQNGEQSKHTIKIKAYF